MGWMLGVLALSLVGCGGSGGPAYPSCATGSDSQWTVQIADPAGAPPYGTALPVGDGSVVVGVWGLDPPLVIGDRSIGGPAFARISADGTVAAAVTVPGQPRLLGVDMTGAPVGLDTSSATLLAYDAQLAPRWTLPLSMHGANGGRGGGVGASGDIAVVSSTPSGAFGVLYVESSGSVRWNVTVDLPGYCPSSSGSEPAAVIDGNGDVLVFENLKRARLRAADGVVTEMVTLGGCPEVVQRDGSSVFWLSCQVTRYDATGAVRWTATVPTCPPESVLIGADDDVYVTGGQYTDLSNDPENPNVQLDAVTVYQLAGDTGALRASRSCQPGSTVPDVVEADASGYVLSWIGPGNVIEPYALQRFDPIQP